MYRFLCNPVCDVPYVQMCSTCPISCMTAVTTGSLHHAQYAWTLRPFFCSCWLIAFAHSLRSSHSLTERIVVVLVFGAIASRLLELPSLSQSFMYLSNANCAYLHEHNAMHGCDVSCTAHHAWLRFVSYSCPNFINLQNRLSFASPCCFYTCFIIVLNQFAVNILQSSSSSCCSSCSSSSWIACAQYKCSSLAFHRSLSIDQVSTQVERK